MKLSFEGKQSQNRDLYKVVKLVQPSDGRIVRLQIVSDTNEQLPDKYKEEALQMYVDLLVDYAQKISAEVTISGRDVTLNCPNCSTAEIVKRTWK